jgi:hypothetical protein
MKVTFGTLSVLKVTFMALTPNRINWLSFPEKAVDQACHEMY